MRRGSREGEAAGGGEVRAEGWWLAMRRELGDFSYMNALLEVPAIRERALKFSVEDYHRFTEGQPTELLRGTIIEKTSRSPLH